MYKTCRPSSKRYFRVSRNTFPLSVRFLAARGCSSTNAISDQPHALTEALTFVGISLSLTLILQTPLLPEKTDFWQFFGVSILTDLILIAVSTGIIRVSWKIVGGQASFDKLLKVVSYHSGVMIPLVLLVFLCSVGVLKIFNPLIYRALFPNKPNEAVVPTFSPLESKAFIAATIIFFVGYFLVCVWSLFAWGAYRILNQGSRGQSVIALALSTVLTFPAMGLLLFVIIAVTTTVN